MASASPIVTPTPGTVPIPTENATGSTNTPATQVAPAGVDGRAQPTTAAGRVGVPAQTALSPLSPAAGYSGPGKPRGAVSADQRPY